MYLLILLLTASCIIFAFFSIRSELNGHNWSKWDPKRKLNYVARILTNLKRKGDAIKNPPLYYITELDRFYIKDEANLEYNVPNVLANLIRIHEPK